MNTETTVIGIDFSTNPRKVGLARGIASKSGLKILEALRGETEIENLSKVQEWVNASPPLRTLIAIDAPLGWPLAMGSSLSKHEAGQPTRTARNDLFSRKTEQLISERPGVTALDVGSNRIARTAHAALDFIADLGKRLGKTIPLTWGPKLENDVALIEVYPAATLGALSINHQKYKGKSAPATDVLKTMLTDLKEHLTSSSKLDCLSENDHAFDAVVCALAAFHFLQGKSMGPRDEQLDLTKTEGWIWALDPDQ